MFYLASYTVNVQVRRVTVGNRTILVDSHLLVLLSFRDLVANTIADVLNREHAGLILVVAQRKLLGNVVALFGRNMEAVVPRL